MASIKVKCPECKEEHLPKTFQKYGGICRKCYLKTHKPVKEKCPKCGKGFLPKTLEKNGGTCGRCKAKDALTGLEGDMKKLEIVEEGKKKCLGCHKEFKVETLEKNEGYCGRCIKTVDPTKHPTETIRAKVWNYHFEGKAKVKCPLCEMKEITTFDFEIGHDKAKAKGGTDDLDNLMPICRRCNTDQGTMTFKEFKKTLPEKKTLWKKLFS